MRFSILPTLFSIHLNTILLLSTVKKERWRISNVYSLFSFPLRNLGLSVSVLGSNKDLWLLTSFWEKDTRTCRPLNVTSIYQVYLFIIWSDCLYLRYYHSLYFLKLDANCLTYISYSFFFSFVCGQNFSKLSTTILKHTSELFPWLYQSSFIVGVY